MKSPKQNNLIMKPKLSMHHEKMLIKSKNTQTTPAPLKTVYWKTIYKRTIEKM